MKYLVIVVLAINLVSCTNIKNQTSHPNIVWITSEDNSKHYMKLFDEHGVATPNIESLAEQGVIFNNAFSNTPVCSAARSTLISGCYGPRAASHYHRHLKKVPMPTGVEMFPAYLRQAGYFTSNNKKEDFNFFRSDSVWNEVSGEATWRHRKEGQSFFYVKNSMTTHESRLHFSEDEMQNHKTVTNPANCFVQPNHPNTDLFKYTNAYYRDKIVQMDGEVGEILKQLKEDGLMEETIIFYFGDHGGVLPGSKGYIYETGLNVPLVVYVPEKYKHLVNLEPGSTCDGFVSFVDFGATVLNLAGIELPEGIDGKPFLGKDVSAKEINSRDEAFSYTDRMDEKYDMVRAIRKGKYKYMRNFQPDNFDALMNNYRFKQLAYQEWQNMYDGKKLDAIQAQFFQSKPVEALYDIESDPYETTNLANDPKMKAKLLEMRSMLSKKMLSINDLALYPEFYLVKEAFDNPVAFGKEHKEEIAELLGVANLQLASYAEAKPLLKQNLESSNPWKRYWALTACSCFGEEAGEMSSIISDISKSDAELINRVRAAEFLAIAENQSPVEVISNALYNSKDANEALLIINSIVVLQDGVRKIDFKLDYEKIPEVARKHQMVQWRLKYLKVGENNL